MPRQTLARRQTLPNRTDANTKAALALAATLGFREIEIPALEARTADGRTWELRIIPAGRGRRPDGSWGPKAGARGGIRLIEVDPDTGNTSEHTAPGTDLWDAGDAAAYLAAITSA